VISVLIIAFLRKAQIENLIRVASSQGVSKIFVSMDGPRNNDDNSTQLEIIELIDALRRELPATIQVRRSSLNVGPGAAVISGIDWLFEQESQGIVLEDDLLPDPSFFKEAELFLNRTDIDPRVLMFSGTNYFTSRKKEIALLRYPVVWGWATTHDKWAIIRSLIFSPISDLSMSKLGVDYYYWRVGKRRALKGQTRVWDVPLAGSMFNHNYYCALSPTNLITNTGTDIYASNTKENRWPLNLETDFTKVSVLEVPISLESSKEREQFMRKKIFNIKLKFILSSFFWNFFDSLRWRSATDEDLERKVSKIQWKYF